MLKVRNLGHVPSKKNMHYPSAGGTRVLMDKKAKAWLKSCTASFVSQLCSACPTSEAGIVTVPSLRSLIASLPHDDNWKVISEETVKAVRVPKGEEGADILIEQIL